MESFINWLDLYFGQKAPQLPAGVRGFIVKIMPWLVLIGIIWSIPSLFAILGFGTFARYNIMYWSGAYEYAWMFNVVILILEVIALPALFNRKMKGWKFIFYATLVCGISNLVMMNIGSLIIGLLVGFYLLFQIRSYYTA